MSVITKRKAILVIVAAVATVSLIVTCVVVYAKRKGLLFPQTTTVVVQDSDFIKNDTIIDGVWVGELNLGGMTQSDAEIKVAEVIKTKSAATTIILDVVGKERKESLAQLGIESDAKVLVKAAYQIGRLQSGEEASEATRRQQADLVNFLKLQKFQLGFGFKLDQAKLETILTERNSKVKDAGKLTAKSFDASTLKFAFSEAPTEPIFNSKVASNTILIGLKNYLDAYGETYLQSQLLKINGIKDQAQMTTTTAANSGVVMEPADYNQAKLEEIKILLDATNLTTPPSVDEMNKDIALLSSVTISMGTGSRGRETNLRRGSELLNGTIINPGETISFNKILGPQTIANGFAMAIVQINGKNEQGIGGGVCQISTTLFQAAMNADLSLAEYHNHAVRSAYASVGFDATVSDWLDLQLKNDKKQPYAIVGEYRSGTVIMKLYGPKLEDGVTIKLEMTRDGTVEPGPDERKLNPEFAPGQEKIVRDRATGLYTSTYRVYYKNGNVIKRERIARGYYEAYSQITEHGPVVTTPSTAKPTQPTTKTTTTPKPTTTTPKPTTPIVPTTPSKTAVPKP